MDVEEIVTVGIFVLAFFFWFYFTIKLDPKKALKEKPKFLRIINLTLGIFFLTFMWFGSLDKSIFLKVAMTLLALGFIYNNLNGWIFNVKDWETKSN